MLDAVNIGRRPDVMLLGPEWPDRALLRAQLIEDGYEVVAIDEWPMPRVYRRPEMRPRAMIVDLRGLPQPRGTLEQVTWVMPADRVLVMTALGTLSPGEVRHMGFTAVQRPVTVGDVVAATAKLLAR